MVVTDHTLTGAEYKQDEWPQAGTLQELAASRILPMELAAIVVRLTEFLELHPGWNSYRSAPTQVGAVTTALNVLARLARLGSVKVLPEIAPTSRGGVQLQWSRNDDAVEIECDPNGTVQILVDIDGRMIEWTMPGVSDPRLSEALAWVEEIA